MIFAPGTTETMLVTYTVPAAALTSDRGRLVYRLDANPQGMVTPERVDVTVHFPKGYAVRDLPEGWTRTDRSTATWAEDGLVDSPSWDIVGVK